MTCTVRVRPHTTGVLGCWSSTVMKCPYGDCTAHNIPLWNVMSCPYGLHGTRASSHDRSPWLLELDWNDAKVT